MKKTVLITTAITFGIFTIVFYSCTKEAQESNAATTPSTTAQTSVTSNARLAHTATTIKLTKEILDLGVTQISLLSDTNNEYVFRLTATALQFNGIDNFSLDQHIVRLIPNGSFITMVYENGKRLHYDTGKKLVFFEVDGKQVPLREWSSGNLVLNKEEEDLLGWGLVVFNEFVNNDAVRYIGGAVRQKHGGWVTYNVGSSRSMALLRTQREASLFLHNNPNCVIVGDYDTSCLWDNHACVASVHYNCV